MVTPGLLSGVVAVLGAISGPVPCSVVGPLPTPQMLVDRAALIVHARAEGVADVPGTTGNISAGSRAQIRFRVLSVLKGKPEGTELTFNGQLEAADDWNNRAVPYDFIRPGGRAGTCYALGYKAGAEYLLLLNPTDPNATDKKSWSPYWAPLSPTNEQVRGARDQWLVWVAQRVK